MAAHSDPPSEVANWISVRLLASILTVAIATTETSWTARGNYLTADSMLTADGCYSVTLNI